MKVTVDTSKVHIQTTVENVIKVAKTRQDEYATSIKEIMQREFYALTHKGDYGRATPLPQGSNASIAQQGLVAPRQADGHYRVGAKKGAVYGSTYEAIFGRLAEGHEYKEAYAFELPKHRKSASESGIWWVKTIEPTPFVKQTMEALKGREGDELFKTIFKKDIERAINRGKTL